MSWMNLELSQISLIYPGEIENALKIFKKRIIQSGYLKDTSRIKLKALTRVSY